MQTIYVDDFASIYEVFYGTIDWLEYYRLRDNFIEYNERQLYEGKISDEEFYNLFQREPEIDNLQLRALAEATAKDYLFRNGFTEVPSWTDNTVLDEEDAFFVTPCFDTDTICDMIYSTPDMYKEKRVFVGSKHTEYR